MIPIWYSLDACGQGDGAVAGHRGPPIVRPELTAPGWPERPVLLFESGRPERPVLLFASGWPERPVLLTGSGRPERPVPALPWPVRSVPVPWPVRWPVSMLPWPPRLPATSLLTCECPS